MKQVTSFLLIVCAVSLASAAYYRCGREPNKVTPDDLTETLRACELIMGPGHIVEKPDHGVDSHSYCNLTNIMDYQRSYRKRCEQDLYICYEFTNANTVIECTL